MSMDGGRDWEIPYRPTQGDALLRSVMAGGVAIFMGTSCWLFGRHLAGAFRPLSNSSLLVASFSVTLIITLGRWYECISSRCVPGAIKRHGLLSVAVVLFLVAISFPRLAPLATVIAWAPILGEEILWWFVLWPRAKSRPADAVMRCAVAIPTKTAVSELGRSAARVFEVPAPEDAADEEIEEEFGEEECESDASLLPLSVTQQVTRERPASGGEYLYGLLRCSFQRGEQNQNVHIAFCPPLNSIPEITVRQLEGEDAHPKIGMAQTFGARFELRLSSVPLELTHVILQFEAQTATVK